MPDKSLDNIVVPKLQTSQFQPEQNLSAVPKIQIAFQGGGAKLVAMLPVAAAFRKCHDDGTIAISAVSGASAGSICAALIASEADFKEVVTYLRAEGSLSIGKIVTQEARRFSEMLDAGRWDKTKYVVKNLPFLYRLLFAGYPILEEKEFANFIRGLFKSSAYKKVEETKIKLFINASDIVRQQNRNILEGYIHAAVTDSASIPLAFRSFRALSRTHVVDGGLCQNLPADILLKTSADPIFAVFPEFAEESKEIGNILQYCFALFSASIAHNVQRSREQISKAFSMGVPCEYNTFDFEAALKSIQDDNAFKASVAEYEAQIRDFARNYGTLHSRTHFRFSDIDTKSEYIDVVEELSRDYLDYIDFKLSRFHVFVNCDRFIPENDRTYRRPADTVVKSARFVVKKEGFKYYRSSLGLDSENAPRPAIWTARNITKGIDLDISVLALNKVQRSVGTGTGCLVLFKDAAQAISVGDEIEIVDSSYVKDGMVDMNRRRNDFLSMTNSHKSSIENVELVITFPKKIGPYRMINAVGETMVESSLVKPLQFSEAELKSVPPELDMIGISTSDLPPDKKFVAWAVLAGS